MKKIQKGFTLIELLIVIAIIGILAGVILVSTSSARNKAQLSSATQALRSAMPLATSCYMSNTAGVITPANNGQICTGDPSLGNWPDLAASSSTAACNFGGSGTAPTVTCAGTTITCNTTNSSCK